MDRLENTLERLKQECSAVSAPAKQYACSECKDIGFLTRRDENGREFAIACKCRITRQIREAMEHSGIAEDFKKKTFDNFDTRENVQLSKAKIKAMQYVQNFLKTEHDRYNSIMFCGQVGAGKTHLGTAICGALISGGTAVVYMAYRNAITRLKQTIVDERSYNQELKQYLSAQILYIDDLLKGRLTEADNNILYEIVNYRYMNNLPIIISTEKLPGELLEFDEAIGSRIIEMCRGNIIQLNGKELNYRLS